MFTYTLPKEFIEKYNSLDTQCNTQYDYFNSVFKIPHGAKRHIVMAYVYKNNNFLYTSVKKLDSVPFAGYMLPVSLFTENKI